MTSRSQHTIPRFYLRRFLSPGYVYRRGANAPQRTRNPRRVAVRETYYGKRVVGRRSMDEINSMVETTGAPALKKLIYEPAALTSDDWVDLAWLFANLALRTPANINELRGTELEAIRQINKILDAQIRALPSGTVVDTSNLDELNRSADRLRSAHGQLEAEPFIALPAVAKCIQMMQFVLTEASDGSNFITSDRPLALRRFPSGSRVGAGWGNDDAMGQIALSPRHFMLMFYGIPGAVSLGNATPEQVEEWNEETLICADQEVYSAVEHQGAHEWMERNGRWSH